MKKMIALSCAIIMVCMLCVTFFNASETASYILGDVNGDGEVDILDATAAQRVLAHLLKDDDGMYAKRGDIDGDGDLTSVDVTYIQRYLAHLPIPYPIDEVVTEPTEPATEEPTIAPTEAPTQGPTSKPDPYELPPI